MSFSFSGSDAAAISSVTLPHRELSVSDAAVPLLAASPSSAGCFRWSNLEKQKVL